MPRPDSSRQGWLRLPASLRELLERHYPGTELAQRALYAPLPLFEFRSVSQFLDLWCPDASQEDQSQRRAIEAELAFPLYAPAKILRDPMEPFFPAPETTGQLISPYPGIDDAMHWLLLMLVGNDPEILRRELSVRSPAYGHRSLLELVQVEARPLSPTRLLRRVRFGRLDWRRLGYRTLYASLTGQSFV